MSDLYILNEKFETHAIVDTYKSFIWTERYYEAGDFEIVVPASKQALEIFKDGYYIEYPDLTKDIPGLTPQVCVIEKREIATDVETGNVLTISGRDALSYLDRRIIWKQTNIKGKFIDGIKALLDANVINPSDANRKMPISWIDPKTKAMDDYKIDAQYLGESLYGTLVNLAKSYHVGMEMYPLLDDREGAFNFHLYQGSNRSYSQTDNSYVVFSPQFDNLINANWINGSADWKNTTLIGGEQDENKHRKYTAIADNGSYYSGINRREIFTDASGVSSKIEGTDKTMSDAEYTQKLVQAGKDTFAEHQIDTSFEGKAETTRMFRYNHDFFMGDIVEVIDAYGNQSSSRITEFVHSEDENGTDSYPTFTSLDKKELTK